MEIDVFPKDIVLNLFGHEIAVRETFLAALILIAVIIVFAVILRVFFINRFTTDPKKIGKVQMIFEYVMTMLDKFTTGALGRFGEKIAPFILAVGFYLIFSGVTELFGMRTPLSDLTTTLAFGLSTFVLINYYGIREKGIGGRLKSYLPPKAIMAPLKLIRDIATPNSLSCRLFGNLVGGYIVMELLYDVLLGLVRKYAAFVLPEVLAAAVPGVLALYFTLFHVLIQFYIFSMLTMTFIREAVED